MNVTARDCIGWYALISCELNSISVLSVSLSRAAAACSTHLGELTGLACQASSCLAPCPFLSRPQAAVASIAEILYRQAAK